MTIKRTVKWEMMRWCSEERGIEVITAELEVVTLEWVVDTLVVEACVDRVKWDWLSRSWWDWIVSTDKRDWRVCLPIWCHQWLDNNWTIQFTVHFLLQFFVSDEFWVQRDLFKYLLGEKQKHERFDSNLSIERFRSESNTSDEFSFLRQSSVFFDEFPFCSTVF